MVGGSLGLFLAAGLHGESVPDHVTAKAWWALAYLVVFGSVIAFTAYSWLLGSVPVSLTATYAYVNPVVAVALGAVLAGERLSATSVVGGLITVVAVFLVVSQEGRKREPVVPEGVAEPYVPTDRQGRLRSSVT
jgi:drug/metabolite transporter (DMT)-like permease